LSGFYLNDGSLSGFLWFRITALRDFFKRKKLAPLFHPIRKPKQIVICSHTIYRASRQLRNNEFLLVRLTMRVLEQLLWFWFHDTQLKTSILDYTDGLENSRHFLFQSELKPKPIVAQSQTFSVTLIQHVN